MFPYRSIASFSHLFACRVWLALFSRAPLGARPRRYFSLFPLCLTPRPPRLPPPLTLPLLLAMDASSAAGEGGGSGRPPDSGGQAEWNPFLQPEDEKQVTQVQRYTKAQKDAHNAKKRKKQKDKRFELRNQRIEAHRVKVRANPYNAQLRGLTTLKSKEVKREAKAQMTESPHVVTQHTDPSSSTHPIAGSTRVVDTANLFTVYRGDRRYFSRNDVIEHLTPMILEAEINSMTNNPEAQMTHNIISTNRNGEAYEVETNSPQAVVFYSDAISKATRPEGAPTFEVFSPGDSPLRRRIMGDVYRSVQGLKDKMYLAFAAGSGGAVRPSQVKQYRPPVIQTNGWMHVYLELDEQALDWLSSRNFVARIGPLMISWRAITIPGLVGRFKPTDNQQEIREELIRGLRERTQASMAGDLEKSTPMDFADQPADEAGNAEELSEIGSQADLNIETEDLKLLEPVSEAESELELDSTVVHSTPTKDAAKRSRTPDLDSSFELSHRGERKLSRSSSKGDVHDQDGDYSEENNADDSIVSKL